MTGEDLYRLYQRTAVEQIAVEMPSWEEALAQGDRPLWDAMAADLAAKVRDSLYEQATVDEVRVKIVNGIDGKKDCNATWRSAVSTQEGAVRDILDLIAGKIAPR